MRIVSLTPGATETVALLGAQRDLVGRSHLCDFPPGVLGAAVLTRARAPRGRAPHAQTRGDGDAPRLAAGPPVGLDRAALADLAPDLVITRGVCDACPIDPRSVRAACDAIPSRPEVLTLNPRSVDEILDDIGRVACAIGREEEGRRAVVDLSHRMDRVLEHVNPYDDGPVCGFMEWTDPIYCAGQWSVQLIERAGARHPLNPTHPAPGAGAAAGLQHAQRRAGPSIAVTPEELAASAPEWLVVAPRGLTLDRAERALRDLRAAAPWFEGLPACRRGRVAIVDGSAMFNRPGPRIVDALGFLVGWIQGRESLIPRGFPWRPMSA